MSDDRVQEHSPEPPIHETELAQELGPDLVHHAFELVSLAPELDEDAERIVVSAVLESLAALRAGSTRVPAREELIALADSPETAPILGRGPDCYKPLILIDGWLYHQRTLHYERRLADAVARRLRTPRGEVRLDAAAIEAIEHAGTPPLTEEQRTAVQSAASLPLCIVTGGPGTGKTFIVVALLRLLTANGVDPRRIALGAPTGKAANRLGESIWRYLGAGEVDAAVGAALEAAPPTTLHRMLRYEGERGTFRRDETDPIPARWVIVDEASMIDLVLMERLLRCVAEDAHLVLLGDVQQLPSVDAGAVLRDLVAADHYVCRLRQSHRMNPEEPRGRAILRFAESIREGDAAEARARLDEHEAVQLHAIDSAEYRPRLLEFVERWFDERITAHSDFWSLIGRRYTLVEGHFSDEDLAGIRELFAHYARFRILCLTRVFAGGTNALNEAFHSRLARRTSPEDSSLDFIAGEPVLMLRNDYDRGLFNGDHGVVLRVDSGDGVRLHAVFDNGGELVAHHLGGFGGQLAHAWAMTAHKSQGSEFEEVAVILPEEDVPLLTRELLYTAVTRARHAVTLFGNPALLDTAVARAIERHSGLAERIAALTSGG